MNIELPEHLKATAGLLSVSLRGSSQEKAPPMPRSLTNDLIDREQPGQSAPNNEISWFEKALSFASTPSFGLAASAMVVVGFLAPVMIGPVSNQSSDQETFRGGHVVYTASKASIVLITEEPGIRNLLEDSGLFDMSVVIETSDPLVAASIPTAKLLVDVKGGAMIAYNAESREVLADRLPEDRSQIAERIALAFGALH